MMTAGLLLPYLGSFDLQALFLGEIAEWAQDVWEVEESGVIKFIKL